MTKKTAKKITLTVLDRWASLDARLKKEHGVRFVVLKNRTPVAGRQDAGYMFSSRQDAITFAESHYQGDFALFALTSRGSLDITPE